MWHYKCLYAVFFDQFNEPLLNKSIFLTKKKNISGPSLLNIIFIHSLIWSQTSLPPLCNRLFGYICNSVIRSAMVSVYLGSILYPIHGEYHIYIGGYKMKSWWIMCQKLRHLILPPWTLSFIFASKGILFQTSHLGILWWNVYDAVSDLIHFLVGSSLWTFFIYSCF